MKKTCAGCRAENAVFRKCSLDYRTELLKAPSGYEGTYAGMKPLEDCPKPKTIMALYNARRRGE